MRAARFHGWGTTPVVEDVPEPVRGPGELLVRVDAAAVAHLDVTVSSGEFGLKPRLPYIGGVEGAGVVIDSDADSGMAEGTRVMLRGAGLGMKRDGTWAEFVSVPSKAAMRLDLPLAPEVAATFFVPATTGYVAVHDVGVVQPDDHVIVAGAGGAVGSMVTQQALGIGAHVVAVVADDDARARVPAGAETVALTDTGAIRALAEERPASVLVDTLGGPGLIERARWVRPGGRAVLIGYVLGSGVELDLSTWLLDDVSFLPVNMIRRERRAREIAGQLLEQLSSGTLRIDTQDFALEDIAEAVDALRGGRLRGRAVVTPHPPDRVR
ncbi:quinone oxidoreductase family protein [Amycolatopsis sp. NPDC004368]